MNGFYSGTGDDSHRAWIPNFSALRVYHCEYNHIFRDSCEWRFNIRQGIFMQHITEKQFELYHLTYAHRAYKNIVVNQIFIKRRDGNDVEKISLNLQQLYLNEKDDEGNKVMRDDVTFGPELIRDMVEYKVISKNGYQNEVEDYRFQVDETRINIIYNSIPQDLILGSNESFKSFRFLFGVSYEAETSVDEDFMNLLLTPDEQLLKLHTDAWDRFWDNNLNIVVKDNNDLASAIHSSIFSLASSIPTSLTAQTFYGPMAPDLGHTTANNELWILPALNFIDPNFSRKLLNYRFRTLPIVMNDVDAEDLIGARFPVKSGYTGIELESNLNLMKAIHVSADIAFGMRQYYALTQDENWMMQEGCMILKEIAKFYSSVATFNESSGHFDIKDVTGLDENYPGVDNDLFTNAVVGYALFFAACSECVCSQLIPGYKINLEEVENFENIAKHLAFNFDSELGAHSKFNGFNLQKMNRLFKQPDVIMLQFPLEYKMNRDQLMSDYKIYKRLIDMNSISTISHTVHAIASLDLNNTQEADELFESSYKGFVREPFYVWCEKSSLLDTNCGQSHYLPGAGAFLQLVINGYLGIRPRLDHLLILKPRMLPKSSAFSVSGLNYMGMKFGIVVDREKAVIVFKETSDEFSMEINGAVEIIKDYKKYEIPESGLIVRSNDEKLEACPLPLDIIGEKLPSNTQKAEPIEINSNHLSEPVPEMKSIPKPLPIPELEPKSRDKYSDEDYSEKKEKTPEDDDWAKEVEDPEKD
uniref:CSON011194 protein n=1 Tax=Culicoides sonorensis TaxID=179676 RepID=A0A336K549_CULSO